MKLLLAAMAALCLGTANPSPEISSITVPMPKQFGFAATYLIQCAQSYGSGVRIDDDLIMTAHHVIDKPGPCEVGGLPIEIIHRDPDHDFAVVRARLSPGLRAVVSCEGVNEGQRYMSLGYTLGKMPAIQMIVGNGREYGDGARGVSGRLHPGTSGGPTIDMDGGTVAINVRAAREADVGAVMPLTETYLCA